MYLRVINRLKYLSFRENILLLLLLIHLSFSIYFAFTIPVYFDEALTYTEYARNGLHYSLFTYNSPNNHVLYSLICSLLIKLPFNDLVEMRIFNSILSVVVAVILYNKSAVRFGENISLVILFVFLSSYQIILYSFMARGYMLSMLFTVLLFIYLDNFKNESFSSKHLIFSFFIALGLFSVLTYSYAVAALTLTYFAIYLHRKLFRKCVQLIIVILSAVLMATLCYSPILIKNGFDFFFSNNYAKEMKVNYAETIHHLPNYLDEYINTAFNLPYSRQLGIVVLIVIAMAGLYSRRNNKYSLVLLISTLISISIILLHSVRSESKYYLFLFIPFVFSIGEFLEFIRIKLSQYKYSIFTKPFLICLVILFMFVNIHFYWQYKILKDFTYYKKDFVTKNIVDPNMNIIHSYYFDSLSSDLSPYVRFYMMLNKKDENQYYTECDPLDISFDGLNKKAIRQSDVVVLEKKNVSKYMQYLNPIKMNCENLIYYDTICIIQNSPKD